MAGRCKTIPGCLEEYAAVSSQPRRLGDASAAPPPPALDWALDGVSTAHHHLSLFVLLENPNAGRGAGDAGI